MASNTSADPMPMPASSARRRAFSWRQMPHRSATSGRWSMHSGSGGGVGQQPGGHADVAEHGNLDRVEPTQGHRVEVDLYDRLVAGDAGVVRERGPEGD